MALELKTFVANREKRLPSLYQIKTFLDAFEVGDIHLGNRDAQLRRCTSYNLSAAPCIRGLFQIDNMTREPETAAALLPMVVQDPRNGDVILRLANVSCCKPSDIVSEDVCVCLLKQNIIGTISIRVFSSLPYPGLFERRPL